MELALSLQTKKSSPAKGKTVWYRTSTAKFIFALMFTLAFCSAAMAGSDDGALGDLWAYMSESLTGAPGKILAAAMLISAGYFSILKPNPGLALVSAFMMLVLANGEKIISGFLDAGIPL